MDRRGPLLPWRARRAPAWQSEPNCVAPTARRLARETTQADQTARNQRRHRRWPAAEMRARASSSRDSVRPRPPSPGKGSMGESRGAQKIFVFSQLFSVGKYSIYRYLESEDGSSLYQYKFLNSRCSNLVPRLQNPWWPARTLRQLYALGPAAPVLGRGPHGLPEERRRPIIAGL